MEIGALLEQERFDPPSTFHDQALIGDDSEHEAAASDPQGWWAKQAEALHWFEKWDTVLDESEAPLYKWFVGGISPDAVKERMEFSEAKALITVDQARRKGKAADIKPAVDRFLGDVPSIETVVVVRNTGADVSMEEGRDLFYDEAIEAASDD